MTSGNMPDPLDEWFFGASPVVEIDPTKTYSVPDHTSQAILQAILNTPAGTNMETPIKIVVPNSDPALVKHGITLTRYMNSARQYYQNHQEQGTEMQTFEMYRYDADGVMQAYADLKYITEPAYDPSNKKRQIKNSMGYLFQFSGMDTVKKFLTAVEKAFLDKIKDFKFDNENKFVTAFTGQPAVKRAAPAGNDPNQPSRKAPRNRNTGGQGSSGSGGGDPGQGSSGSGGSGAGNTEEAKEEEYVQPGAEYDAERITQDQAREFNTGEYDQDALFKKRFGLNLETVQVWDPDREGKMFPDATAAQITQYNEIVKDLSIENIEAALKVHPMMNWDLGTDPPSQGKPRKYQVYFIQHALKLIAMKVVFGEKAGKSILLAHSMGLGKTLTSIMTALIACPVLDPTATDVFTKFATNEAVKSVLFKYRRKDDTKHIDILVIGQENTLISQWKKEFEDRTKVKQPSKPDLKDPSIKRDIEQSFNSATSNAWSIGERIKTDNTIYPRIKFLQKSMLTTQFVREYLDSDPNAQSDTKFADIHSVFNKSIGILIVDEVHENPGTGRTPPVILKAIEALAIEAAFCIGLSGTPTDQTGIARSKAYIQAMEGILTDGTRVEPAFLQVYYRDRVNLVRIDDEIMGSEDSKAYMYDAKIVFTPFLLINPKNRTEDEKEKEKTRKGDLKVTETMLTGNDGRQLRKDFIKDNRMVVEASGKNIINVENINLLPYGGPDLLKIFEENVDLLCDINLISPPKITRFSTVRIPYIDFEVTEEQEKGNPGYTFFKFLSNIMKKDITLEQLNDLPYVVRLFREILQIDTDEKVYEGQQEPAKVNKMLASRKVLIYSATAAHAAILFRVLMWYNLCINKIKEKVTNKYKLTDIEPSYIIGSAANQKPEERESNRKEFSEWDPSTPEHENTYKVLIYTKTSSTGINFLPNDRSPEKTCYRLIATAGAVDSSVVLTQALSRVARSGQQHKPEFTFVIPIRSDMHLGLIKAMQQNIVAAQKIMNATSTDRKIEVLRPLTDKALIENMSGVKQEDGKGIYDTAGTLFGLLGEVINLKLYERGDRNMKSLAILPDEAFYFRKKGTTNTQNKTRIKNLEHQKINESFLPLLEGPQNDVIRDGVEKTSIDVTAMLNIPEYYNQDTVEKSEKDLIKVNLPLFIAVLKIIKAHATKLKNEEDKIAVLQLSLVKTILETFPAFKGQSGATSITKYLTHPKTIYGKALIDVFDKKNFEIKKYEDFYHQLNQTGPMSSVLARKQQISIQILDISLPEYTILPTNDDYTIYRTKIYSFLLMFFIGKDTKIRSEIVNGYRDVPFAHEYFKGAVPIESKKEFDEYMQSNMKVMNSYSLLFVFLLFLYWAKRSNNEITLKLLKSFQPFITENKDAALCQKFINFLITLHEKYDQGSAFLKNSLMDIITNKVEDNLMKFRGRSINDPAFPENGNMNIARAVYQHMVRDFSYKIPNSNPHHEDNNSLSSVWHTMSDSPEFKEFTLYCDHKRIEDEFTTTGENIVRVIPKLTTGRITYTTTRDEQLNVIENASTFPGIGTDETIFSASVYYIEVLNPPSPGGNPITIAFPTTQRSTTEPSQSTAPMDVEAASAAGDVARLTVDRTFDRLIDEAEAKRRRLQARYIATERDLERWFLGLKL